MSTPLPEFDFDLGTRLIHGAGSLDRIGDLAGERGARTALIVTDPHIVEAGHVARAEAALREAGIRVAVYDGVHENPTTLDVDAVVDAARVAKPDILIGLGGGSPIDAAKGCNFIYTNGGRMEDYRGHHHAPRPMLPMIAVPTTAGTGSEVQSFALISNAETHQKMACGDEQTRPCIAILDPTLTVSQPRFVIACSGLDAITHATESAVTTSRNPVSHLFSQASFRLAHEAFPRVLADPNDLDAQSHMLLAATYAGIAIENSMLGAAHSMANPLTAQFDVVHGHAVGMMIPHIVRFNAVDPEAERLYAGLATTAGLSNGNTERADAVARLVSSLESMFHAAGLPATLDACGVSAPAVPDLAAGAATQWTAQFNPRPVSAADFERLYEAAFAPAPEGSSR